MSKQDDSCADNDLLCCFSYAVRKYAYFTPYRCKGKYAVVDIHERPVCESYTDSEIVKMEQEVKLCEKYTKIVVTCELQLKAGRKITIADHGLKREFCRNA